MRPIPAAFPTDLPCGGAEMVRFWSRHCNAVPTPQCSDSMRGASPELLGIGGVSLVLSLLFACGFFHSVTHEPWEKLLADYNRIQGRLRIVVWLTTLFAPLIYGKILPQL